MKFFKTFLLLLDIVLSKNFRCIRHLLIFYAIILPVIIMMSKLHQIFAYTLFTCLLCFLPKNKIPKNLYQFVQRLSRNSKNKQKQKCLHSVCMMMETYFCLVLNISQCGFLSISEMTLSIKPMLYRADIFRAEYYWLQLIAYN